ncbi:MAG: transposase [Candidatus Micrarchaeia archaeon]
MNKLRRTSRIFLNSLNAGKTERLIQFLYLYANVVRYFIEMLWSNQDFSGKFGEKTEIDRAVARFGITARLSQLAYKQAKEIVKSQRKKSKRKRKMPRFKNIIVNLDCRFFTLSEFQGKHFDWAIKFNSGVPSIIVPFNNTKHSLKFLNSGWALSKSIRIGLKKKRLFIDLIFEKEKPPYRKEGKTIGIDTGLRALIATSEGQVLGTELKEKIEKTGKRRKRFHKFIATEIDRIVKQIDLSDVKVVCVENLKKVKHNKRGKFSRKINRFLSFWHYARVLQRIRQRCEEEGIRLEFKSPYKTSQRCPLCGNIDRKNRRTDRFRCTSCGFEKHADIVGAMNLKVLGLAEAYSLRSLQTQFNGVGINVY